MKLRTLLPCFLVLGLSFSLGACGDDGDDGDSSDSNAENNETDNNEETTGAEDVDCATFCTNYIDLCLQTGKSTEFELNDDCVAACGAWDQAGINCRNEQILADACGEAGNMGSTCN